MMMCNFKDAVMGGKLRKGRADTSVAAWWKMGWRVFIV